MRAKFVMVCVKRHLSFSLLLSRSLLFSVSLSLRFNAYLFGSEKASIHVGKQIWALNFHSQLGSMYCCSQCICAYVYVFGHTNTWICKLNAWGFMWNCSYMTMRCDSEIQNGTLCVCSNELPCNCDCIGSIHRYPIELKSIVKETDCFI